MIPLFSEIEYKESKGKDTLPFACVKCSKTFYKEKKYISWVRCTGRDRIMYCSKKCQSHSNLPILSCGQCGQSFTRSVKPSKSGKYFCKQSCAAIYGNTHKTHGTRRSKLEVFLEEELTKLYPDLEIHFNRKDAINGELDIYIPSLKLAFELNGIFHYEPIYGADKLASIQTNDGRKFQACLEQGIELCIIDSSKIKYWKPQRGFESLDIIKPIIDNCGGRTEI